MTDLTNWADPRVVLPGYFELVSIRLKVYPTRILYGYYCGLGVWFSPDLCGTVTTDDILEWH